MNHFWPGPLTIIFNYKKGTLSGKATAGLQTVAVRMPDHPVAIAIIKKVRLADRGSKCQSFRKTKPDKCAACEGRFRGKNCRDY